MMGVADGNSKCVGSVIVLDFNPRQEDPHHGVDLFLAGVTGADHRFFDQVEPCWIFLGDGVTL